MNKKRISSKVQFFMRIINKKKKKNKAAEQRTQVRYMGKVTFNKLKWNS
jgi:hypothetical protein